MLLTQQAPYPRELEGLVARLGYKPGWQFELGVTDRRQGGRGLTLMIYVTCEDIYHLGQPLTFRRDMPVPAVEYSRRSWQRWLLDQIMLVEQHETLEAFMIDGERVYAPLHGQGDNEYLITEPVDPADRKSAYLCQYGEPPPLALPPPPPPPPLLPDASEKVRAG